MEEKNNPTAEVIDFDAPAADAAKEVKIDAKPLESDLPFEGFAGDAGKAPATIEEAVSQLTQPAAEETADAPKEETPAEPEPAPAAEAAPAEQPAEEKPVEQPAAEADPDKDPLLEGLKVQSNNGMPTLPDTDDMFDLVINQLVFGARTDIMEDMRKWYPDNESVNKATKDENSFLNKVISAMVNGWHTGDGNTIEFALAKNENVGDRLVEQTKCDIPYVPDGRPKKMTHKNVRLSGDEARLILRSRMGGMYRVNLLNSGFWVALRAPQLAELQEIFTTIDLDAKEIGRTMGAHFALISDMYLKRKFVEMLIQHKLISASNFDNIYAPGAFIRNLSFHDYDALVHGVVTLMSRNGLRVQLVCPKCGQVSVEHPLDVSAAKFINMDLMTPEVRKWWAESINPDGSTVKRSEEDLKKYRENILKHTRTIRQEVYPYGKDGEKVTIEMDLSTPTFNRFFRTGGMLISQLNDTITAISNGEEGKEDLARASLTIHGYQLVAPWIKDMRVFQEDGKTVDFVTDDPSVIIEYLDQTIQEGVDNDLFDELHQFVADTRFNYFGSFSIQCPKCKAKPESKLDNFFPVDIQMIFFGLLFRLSPTDRQ